jgi:integrase
VAKSELSDKHITRPRPDAEWYYRFNIAGQKYEGKTGTVNRREAKRIAAEQRDRQKRIAAEETRVNRGPMTFGRACSIWMAEKAPSLLGEGMQSLQAQVDFMQKYIRPGLLLHDIPAADITKMALARAQCLRRGRGGVMVRITPTTVTYTVDLLHRILNYAHKNHGATLQHYDWTIFRPKKERKERGAKTRRALKLGTEQMVLGTIKREYVPVTAFAILSGLRATENLLRKDQIDWNERMAENVKGKGHRAIGRNVMLGRAAMAILQTEANRPDNLTDHVFTYLAHASRAVGKTGRKTIRGTRYPITYSGWNAAWDRMKTALELQGKVRLHDLRHTFATRNAKLVNVRDLQDMMGHAKAETTLEYITPDQGAIREALDSAPMPMPAGADQKVATIVATNSKKIG